MRFSYNRHSCTFQYLFYDNAFKINDQPRLYCVHSKMVNGENFISGKHQQVKLKALLCEAIPLRSVNFVQICSLSLIADYLDCHLQVIRLDHHQPDLYEFLW